MPNVFAAADIGSNTAHLLIAESDGSTVRRIENVNEWIPLGEEVAKKGEISLERSDQLVRVMKEFRKVATDKGAQSLYIFATEAVRSARNHEQTLTRIKKESRVSVNVISPKREAELSLRGIELDYDLNRSDLMFEAGGGSVQIAELKGGKIVEEMSLPLGTGRILAESGMDNPCSEASLLKASNYIDHQLSRIDSSRIGSRAIASGGVARGLWRALHPDSEKELWRLELEYMIWAASRLSSLQIIQRFNVKPKRAGTLLPGALVYMALLKKFKLNSIHVSEFGVREGAVIELSRGWLNGGKL